MFTRNRKSRKVNVSYMEHFAANGIMPDADVIVIGGGAAGTFCACCLACYRKKVILIEPNREIGRKLRITGKGRCNVTNNCSGDDVIKNVVRNRRFLYSSMSAFSPSDTIDWFENRGVPLKTERGGRVFPVSDRSYDIAAAFERELKRFKVRIIRDRATDIITNNGDVIGVKCEKLTYYASKAVLATGGCSYPSTGSTGEGYDMASSLGHRIVATSPSLIPIEIKERFCADLSGLTLKNCTFTLCMVGKKSPVFSELGEMSFTPYGISGPLTLSASCYIDPEKLTDQIYKIILDLKPGLTLEQLERRIQRDFDEYSSAAFEDTLLRLLPSQMIPTVVTLSGIAPYKQCAQISRQERSALAHLLKRFELTPYKLRPIEEAIVTRGGIAVGEINPNTMKSKLVKGLYFAGEIIDVDALTGGYNLQIAFSTAYSAATAIIQELEQEGNEVL